MRLFADSQDHLRGAIAGGDHHAELLVILGEVEHHQVAHLGRLTFRLPAGRRQLFLVEFGDIGGLAGAFVGVISPKRLFSVASGMIGRSSSDPSQPSGGLISNGSLTSESSQVQDPPPVAVVDAPKPSRPPPPST